MTAARLTTSYVEALTDGTPAARLAAGYIEVLAPVVEPARQWGIPI